MPADEAGLIPFNQKAAPVARSGLDWEIGKLKPEAGIILPNPV
jgi:hypothetical protein